ncbi:hypothetical protein V8F06_010886 [Rhypophila decipiens]
MKITAFATILFAAIAMAGPVPDADQGLEAPSANLEARAGCRAGCSCSAGKCLCASCGPPGCVWIPDGNTC